MSTDKFLLEGIKAGYHGTLSVTPVDVPATTRIEVPGTTSSGQLMARKSVLVQNMGPGDVYVGGYNVGFGPGHGEGDYTSCSGVVVVSGSGFGIDAGRTRVYAFNPNGVSVPIKVLEVS